MLLGVMGAATWLACKGATEGAAKRDSAAVVDSAATDTAAECYAGITLDGDQWTMENCEVLPGAYFGAAETGAGAGGWYGEDCLYDPDDDRDGGVEVCHYFPAGSSSLTLTLVYTAPEVSETATMIGYPGSDEWTYVFGWDGGCITWGHDVSHYLPLGCTVP